MKEKPTKILTINATEQEIENWTVTAKELGLSRSRWCRTALERSRDLERILARQKVAKRSPKWTKAEAHEIGTAAINLYDVNHLDSGQVAASDRRSE